MSNKKIELELDLGELIGSVDCLIEYDYPWQDDGADGWTINSVKAIILVKDWPQMEYEHIDISKLLPKSADAKIVEMIKESFRE